MLVLFDETFRVISKDRSFSKKGTSLKSLTKLGNFINSDSIPTVRTGMRQSNAVCEIDRPKYPGSSQELLRC